MEHFQEEVMGRKEAYNFFAKISSPSDPSQGDRW